MRKERFKQVNSNQDTISPDTEGTGMSGSKEEERKGASSKTGSGRGDGTREKSGDARDKGSGAKEKVDVKKEILE